MCLLFYKIFRASARREDKYRNEIVINPLVNLAQEHFKDIFPQAVFTLALAFRNTLKLVNQLLVDGLLVLLVDFLIPISLKTALTLAFFSASFLT